MTPNDVPKLLYRYRPPTIQDITSLSDAKIWFSSPARFNDPFDCAYEIAVDDVSRDECEAALTRISKGRYTAQSIAAFTDAEVIEHSKRGLSSAIAGSLSAVKGVCCFSEIPNDLLMWGHYAAGHSGFCMEFNTAKDPMFQKAKRVRYSNDLPRIGVEVFRGEFEPVMGLLLTKSTHWQYEKEWRILHSDGNFLYGHDRAALTGIYFGAKMPPEQKLMIASLLRETDTKLYEMKVGKSRFELVAEPLSVTFLNYKNSP